jgi:formamidopyrimidine-DNA glycosylase
MKFLLELNPENGEKAIEAAFVDARRLARIRLVDCPGKEIRQNTPLKENGPDPVVDKDIVTVEWLKKKCASKKVPIKAMLLDQANISGIGNWVGDEIMYNAKMHPEQYANTLSDGQVEQLHKSIHYICSTACELLADSDQYPEDWLFKHRWGKGKKDSSKTLPNGEKIAFLTVGGRTSAVVPSIQKKTGPVAKEMDEAEGLDGEEDAPPKKPAGKKRKAVTEVEEEQQEEEVEHVKSTKSKGKKQKTAKEEVEDTEEAKPVKSKGKKKSAKADPEPDVPKAAAAESNGTGRRRSARLK